jgi:hypothetical protein
VAINLKYKKLIFGHRNLIVFRKVKFEGLAGPIKRSRPQVVAGSTCNNRQCFSIYLINAQCDLTIRSLLGRINDFQVNFVAATVFVQLDEPFVPHSQIFTLQAELVARDGQRPIQQRSVDFTTDPGSLEFGLASA